MSADNYVIVKKFGEKDYRWAMFFASEKYRNTSAKKYYHHGSFKTPRQAAENAEKELEVIEYGISFGGGCLCGDCERRGK